MSLLLRSQAPASFGAGSASFGAISVTEEQIHDQLSLLSLRTSRSIRSEVVVFDSLRGKSTRRFDLLEERADQTIIYELKKNPLTDQDVYSTLGIKGYIHLMKERSTLPVSLIFLAPGITPEASRLLDLMAEVTYINLYDFADVLLSEVTQEIRRECPDQVTWYESKIKGTFPLLFNREDRSCHPAQAVQLPDGQQFQAAWYCPLPRTDHKDLEELQHPVLH